jgi:hypothetical protein
MSDHEEKTYEGGRRGGASGTFGGEEKYLKCFSGETNM